MKDITKKAIVIGGVSLMIGTSVPIKSYALESTKTQADIVIRVGEYENKPGKRLDNISSDFDIDLPIREENGIYSVR